MHKYGAPVSCAASTVICLMHLHGATARLFLFHLPACLPSAGVGAMSGAWRCGVLVNLHAVIVAECWG